MNYLAHAYLSFEQPEILVGNMISDFVKGKKRFTYSPGIQEGIILHRAIDRFTDEHQVTREAKFVFQPAYRLYSAAFMDVVYDHFLANDPQMFPGNSLFEFTQWVYSTLDGYTHSLPERFEFMFPYMKQQNWLFNYQLRQGINQSFGGLVRRAVYLTESNTAFKLFEENYHTLQACYNHFFPELKQYAWKMWQSMSLS